MDIVLPQSVLEPQPDFMLPIWQECSRCTRINRCEDPYPPSGVCPHPADHILGVHEHPPHRWPKHWEGYQAFLQDDHELGSIFCRWRIGLPITEADFLKMRERVREYGIAGMVGAGPRWLIWDMLDPDLHLLHSDFCEYYGLPHEQVSLALQAAFLQALFSSESQLVVAIAKQGGAWQLCMIDFTRMYLWSSLKLEYLDLSHLDDKQFRSTFESEWETLQPYRGLLFDFRVVPRLSLDDFVRYQKLPRGDTTIRSILCCYMTHQALVYPHVAKVMAPNLTEVAIVRRLREMYSPLVDAIVQRAAKNLSLAAGQIEEREDIREEAQKAFDRFFQEFEFYWRPGDLQRPLGPVGILGLTEDAKLRSEIDQAFKEHGLSYETQDVAVYAFAHYIKLRMRSWVNESYSRDEDAPPAVSLQSQVGEGDNGTELGDMLAGDSAWPLDVEAWVEEKPDLEGPDGTLYMMIRQAARRYGLSEDQLRRMDKAGSLPVVRAQEVFDAVPGSVCPVPGDTRLYERSAAAENAAEIAKQRARTHSSRLTGQELNRKQAATYLGVKERKLRSLEDTGKIKPQRKGKSLVYTAETLAQVKTLLEERQRRLAQRPRR